MRAKLAFTGDLMPTLDFLAQTQASGITAQIAVTGPAGQAGFRHHLAAEPAPG